MTLSSFERPAWVAGVLGLAAALVGWVLQPTNFSFAWLAALSAWIGWPLGCLSLLLTHALTGGQWGYTIRPQLLTGVAAMPLLLPAVVPLLLVLPHLYPWLHPDVAAQLGNRFYLNVPFAVARGMLYLIAWFGLAALTLSFARRGRSLAAIAPPGLIVLGLTVTFASVDATMSLDPHFVSTVYGMVAAAESGLLALAVCVLAASVGPRPAAEELADLGRLLLGLLILWAYLDFVQFLIVWQSDLPHESPWYIARSQHGWGVLAAGMALGHFVLPFFALMSPRLRRTQRGIGGLAALLIAMEMLRMWWLVLPAGGRSIGWIDLAAMLAFAGLATATALRWPGARVATSVPHA
jgi:hypothetical protein